MADNVVSNPGAGGATFATDDIVGIHHPYTKVEWGPADTANITDDATGKRLPVKIGEALPAGTNNIGDVDILTVPSPLSTTGGGTEATALRVTIASDSTGLVSVDDNGGSLTVDGTVAVSGTVAVTESGTWTVQPGNVPNTAPWLVGHGKTIKTVSGSLTADTVVIALVSTKRLKIIAYSLISSGTLANIVIFRSTVATTELWRVLMQSSADIASGANLSIAAPSFLFATVPGESLTMDVSQADTIHYSITYFDDDAT